jgi:hypothetical protein
MRSGIKRAGYLKKAPVDSRDHLTTFNLGGTGLSNKSIVCLNRSFFTNAAYAFSVVLTEAWPNRCCTSVMAAPLLNRRVANVFLRLCEETSVMPALLTGLGKMNPWWLRVGKHRDLGKRVLECFRLKDTITVIESECCCRDSKPKDSLDQDTNNYTLHKSRTTRRAQGIREFVLRLISAAEN